MPMPLSHAQQLAADVSERSSLPYAIALAAALTSHLFYERRGGMPLGLGTPAIREWLLDWARTLMRDAGLLPGEIAKYMIAAHEIEADANSDAPPLEEMAAVFRYVAKMIDAEARQAAVRSADA